MAAQLTKDQVVDVARILAMYAAAYARRYGELPPEEMLLRLRASDIRPKDVAETAEGRALLQLMRDGAAALTGVLATVGERHRVDERGRLH